MVSDEWRVTKNYFFPLPLAISHLPRLPSSPSVLVKQKVP